jgi:hypothetical protein
VTVSEGMRAFDDCSFLILSSRVMPDRLIELLTYDSVVEVFGDDNLFASGVKPLSILCDQQQPAIYVWRQRGKFPAKYYLVINEALEVKGFYAPAVLFSMHLPKKGAFRGRKRKTPRQVTPEAA